MILTATLVTFLSKLRMIELPEYNHYVYWNSNRISVHPHKKHFNLEEIEQRKQDYLKVKEDFINSTMKLEN